MIHMAPGAADNGLAAMMAQLLEQNIADDPAKKELLSQIKGRVALVAEDSEVAMTLVFDGAGLTVHSGIVGQPDLALRAASDDLIRLSLIETLDPSKILGSAARLLPNPLVAALVGWLMQQAVAKLNVHVPNPKGANVVAIVESIKKGTLRVYGLHKNLGLMLKLGDLFAVKQDNP